MKKLLSILFVASVLFCASQSYAQSTLIHYWNFNGLTRAYNNPFIPPLTADFSVLDTNKAKCVYVLTAKNQIYTGFIDNVTGDTTNARNSAPAGNALRFRNPSDSAELRFYIPSTTYKNLVLKWEVESSSVASGQKTQLFDYSIDSGATWKSSGLSTTSVDITQTIFQGTSWGLISVSISDSLAFNNPNLVFRIKFSGNTSLTSGNNRIDNFTVDGTFAPPVSSVPLNLMHYWNFNTLLTAYHNPSIPVLKADFSAVDTTNTIFVYALTPGTSSNYAGYIDNNSGDLTNSRNGAPAGQSLRFRNPSDSAEMRFYIPSTNYKNIVIKYALQSSSVGSGQRTQQFDFSTDGGYTWKTSGLSITNLDVTQPQFQGSNWGFVSINLTDSTVNNNYNLVFRIKFAGNTTNSSGNNRFDNFTVEGTYVPPVPVVMNFITPAPGDIVTVGRHEAVNLNISGPVGTKRRIEYTINHGLTWTVIGLISGNYVDWIPANTPSTNAYIRIVDENENGGYSGPFTIFYPGPGVIGVTSPAKGSVATINTHVNVTFTATGVVSETRVIDLSIDSGKTWRNLGSVSLANSFDWVVPNTPSTQAMIRVKDTLGIAGYSNIFSIAPAPIAGGKRALIHYWNFDNIVADTVSVKKPNISDIHADYSSLDVAKARIAYFLLPGTSLTAALRFIDPVLGTDSNVRPVLPTQNGNQALRLRNPVDSMELRCFIPTTGHTNIIIKYALESSSTASGDSTNIFDYSIDGGTTWKNGKANGMKVNGVNTDTLDTTPLLFQGTSWGITTIDLSADKTVENNPNVVFRIRFKGNTSLTKGNNRIDNLTVEGDTASTDKITLVHYWNFDNVLADTISTKEPTLAPIHPDYSILDATKAKMSYVLLPNTSLTAALRFIDPVLGTDSNARTSFVPTTNGNQALRLRNPVDSAELRWFIPTTNFTSITIKYALESSSTASGDSTNIFDYSIDGGTTWKNGKANGMKVNGSNVDTLDTTPLIYQGTSWGINTIDLSADPSVENNPNLVFRIRFKGNTSLTKGNNRIDNFTVEGVASVVLPPAISVSAPTLKDTLVIGQHETIAFSVSGAVTAKRIIEYSTDGGTTWLAVGTLTGTSTFDWVVPNTATGKGVVRVRDTANVIGKSATFAIVPAGTVTTVVVGSLPNKVFESQAVAISWVTAGYLGATVNIDLSLDSGKTWTPIKTALSIKSTASYSWTAPGDQHFGALIRLSFASGASGTSAPFSIVPATADVATSQTMTGIRVSPNPTSRNATVSYSLKSDNDVAFSIYDLLGREVYHVARGIETSGMHTINFDVSHLDQGTYVYKLTAGGAVSQGKIVISR